MNNRFVILIELLLAITLYFAYIQPTYSNTIVPLNAEITKVQEAQKSAAQYAQQESALQARVQGIPAQDITRLNTMIPSASHVTHFLYNINTLAANSGFFLTKYSENAQENSSSQQQNTGTPQLQKMTITLSGTGPYASFRTFLDNMQKSLRIIDVQSIKVTAPTNSSGKKGAPAYPTYDMTLTIYWLPPSS